MPRFNKEIGNCMAVSQCRDVLYWFFEAACKTAYFAFFGEDVPFVDMYRKNVKQIVWIEVEIRVDLV